MRVSLQLGGWYAHILCEAAFPEKGAVPKVGQLGGWLVGSA